MGETLNILDSQPYAEGIRFTTVWRNASHTVDLPLFGDFNVENVSLVLATLLALGHDFDVAVTKLQNLQPVAGRMEVFGGGMQPLVFVDYAHTPDALDNVLRSARKHCQGDLWTVFGCGGNRDSGKRALMGNSSAQWADRAIVTDDNPRYEDSTNIINDILTGCDANKTEVIPNREQAIQQAISRADPYDCIVVAGKGHEDYQEINGVKYPFSDCQVVLEALARRA
jgi:UDP-N-acetylmuramoyl-L-alanyl-D-glutamate--2,6-diaminopimelate ligase